MPTISVVMAVYNGATELERTLDSIVNQTYRDFELVVVNDGSTDGTAEILDRYAQRDARIRVLPQANTGLTRSLIRACAEARSPVLARHDAGDFSHPDRLRRQLALLADDVVLVSCGSRFVGPEDEPLYVVTVDPDEVRDSLQHDDAAKLHGIAHGSALFRRDAYERAGGYREQFYLAQDLDLWVRLAPLGRIAADPEPLYTVVVGPRSITSMNHDRQMQMKELIVKLRDGAPQSETLAAAAAIRPRTSARRAAEAAGLYFIGRCLRQQRDRRALSYFVRAIARKPLHLRAWASLLSGR